MLRLKVRIGRGIGRGYLRKRVMDIREVLCEGEVMIWEKEGQGERERVL